MSACLFYLPIFSIDGIACVLAELRALAIGSREGRGKRG
jgi:hypothetical protein